MAFFGSDQEEVRQLKKKLGAQDLKIGSLESERTAYQSQVDELRELALTAQRKYDAEVARAVSLDETLRKHQAESSRQALQITNLQQALDKAQQRESQDARGRKLEEQQRDRALNWQTSQDSEDRKRLEEKLRAAESRLREKDEEIRALQQQHSSSSSGSSKRGIDPAAKALALENENMALRSQVSRLESSMQAASRSFDPLATPVAAAKSRNTRRPRSSSISGCSANAAPASSADPSRLQAQLQELQSVHEETRSDLTKLEARASKAERDALKATNESLAIQKQGDRLASELRDEIRDLKEDLKWRTNDCDALEQQVDELSRRLEQAESSNERADTQTTEEIQQRLAESQEKLQETQASLIKVREELAEVTTQRDEMREDLQALEDENERLQQALETPVTTARSSRAGNGDGDSDDEGQAALRDKELSQRCKTLDAAVQDLTRRLAASETVRQTAISERDNLIVEIDALRTAKDDDDDDDDDDDSASTSSSSSSSAVHVELQSTRMHVSRLQSELAEKDAAVEQAEALAEEDARQLRIAHADTKRLNAELKRFRQKDKELNLEVEVLRVSAVGGDSAQIEKRLAELRKEINARDEQLVQLRETMKRRDDELDAGKKQLKRIGSYLASAGSSKTTECATPRKSSAAAGPAATPISKLFRSNHFFSTPGGRPLQRSFDEDLLDQIELVRETLEGVEQQREFLKIEQETSRRHLEEELRRKAESCEELEVRLTTTREELQARLDEANSKLTELSQGEEARLAANEQRATVDSQRLQQIEQLEDDKKRLGEELTSLRSELQAAQDELKAAEARLQDLSEVHASAVSALEAKVQASQTRAQSISALSDRLDVKWQQLADLAERGQAVARAESSTHAEEKAVNSLEAASDSAAHEHDAWGTTAAESEKILSDCRTSLTTAQETASASRRSSTKAQSATCLQAKVDELQGRILRRNEQIGSQQLKIQKLTTRLSVAEEDSEDLLLEKGEMAEEITALRASVDALRKAREEASASLEHATRRVAELEAQAESPHQDGGELDGESDTSSEGESDNSEELLTLSLQLAEHQTKVTQLTETVEKHQLEVEELNDMLDARDADLEKLRTDYDTLAERLQDGEAQVTREVESAKAETVELQAALDELQLGEKELVAAKEDLQRQLASREDEFRAYKEGTKELQQKLQSLQDEIDRLSVQLAQQEVTQGAPDAEADARIAELTNAKVAVETELDAVQSRHRAELLKRDNEVASLQKDLDEAGEHLRSSTQEKTAAVADLEKAEHALEASHEQLDQLQERVRVAEADLAVKDSDLSQLRKQLDAQTSSEAAAEEKDAAIARLEQELLEFEKKAEAAKTEHSQSLERLSAQLAAAEEAKVAAELGSESLRIAAQQTEHLQTRVSELESINEAVEKRCSIIESAASQAEDDAREKLQAMEKSLSELESRLGSVRSELEERKLALEGAESAIAERDVQMKSRNEEYWSLKEEVAELQEAAERSRLVSQSTAELQSQLEELQAEHDEAERKYESDLERLRSELEASAAQVETLEREGASRESKVADLQAELERRKAASRSAQEGMEELRRQVHVAETKLQTSETNLKRVEAQGDVGDSSALKEEVTFLTSRLKDLEDELSAKAEEVEEADTKILAGLKDSKKLAAKVKTLQRQVEALQGELARSATTQAKVVETVSAPATGPGVSSPVVLREVRDKASPAVSSPSISSSTSFSRKRSAPDEDPVGVPHSFSNGSLSSTTRAVYVDPPAVSSRPISPVRERGGGGGGSGFMPTRKAGPSASVAARAMGTTSASTTTTRKATTPSSPSSSLKDRTNVQAHVVSDAPRKAISATVKATSTTGKTPTAAAVGAPKSSLMQALAAKRKLGAQV